MEGQSDVASLLRSIAEGETGHAHGRLEFLAAVGDPATGLLIGNSRLNLAAAVAGETHESLARPDSLLAEGPGRAGRLISPAQPHRYEKSACGALCLEASK